LVPNVAGATGFIFMAFATATKARRARVNLMLIV
jgi:hypothetical protein